MNIFELEASLPSGFHDALLHAYSVDVAAGVATFRLEICVGDPAAPDYASREARQMGTLTLSGVAYLSIELPDFSYDCRGPYLIDLCSPDPSQIDPRPSAAGKFSGRFFSSSTNSFIHFSAESASFTFTSLAGDQDAVGDAPKRQLL